MYNGRQVFWRRSYCRTSCRRQSVQPRLTFRALDINVVDFNFTDLDGAFELGQSVIQNVLHNTLSRGVSAIKIKFGCV